MAEAVEDETCLDILRSYGVDMVQGFALERPMPATHRPSSSPQPFSSTNAPPARVSERRQG